MVGLPKKVDREELELQAFKAQRLVDELNALVETEGWKTLVDIFDGAEQRYYAEVARQLMRGREINQRKLDFNRGMFAGVRQLLEQPDKAQTVLRRAIERLSETTEEE